MLSARSHQPRSDELVDGAVLDALAEMLGDREDVEELVDLMVDTVADRLLVMTAASAEGRADDVRRDAHRLKSASAQLGAGPLAELAAQVERGDLPPRAVEDLVAATVEAWRAWRTTA